MQTEKRQPNAEKLNERENGIRQLHQEASRVMYNLMAGINKENEGRDPSGWRVYGFDRNTVSAEQVVEIHLGAEDVEPEFEIDFIPSNPDDEVQERRRGDMMRLVSCRNPDINLDIEFLPMNYVKTTFSKMEIRLPATIKGIIDNNPAIVSVLNTDEDPFVNDQVITNGIPMNQHEESLEMSDWIIIEAERLIRGIEERGFHMRVFGNSSHSPIEPKFIIQKDELSGDEQD